MDILKILKRLDFTEYEAKAYLALLSSEQPLTGYAVAKNSGVPRSKIYETIETLLSRGDVIASPGDPPLYQAISAKELISSRKAEAEDNFSKAEKYLAELEIGSHDRDNIWNITGCDAICQKVTECLRSAEKRILLEIWAEDFYAVEDELKDAAKRGVQIIIVSYGELKANYAVVYQHDMSDTITEEYGGRWIVLSVDGSQVLAGAVSLNEKSRAAWTMHSGLVMPITEVIVHDLYIAEIMKKHRDILEADFGEDLIELRQKFSVYPDNKNHYIE